MHMNHSMPTPMEDMKMNHTDHHMNHTMTNHHMNHTSGDMSMNNHHDMASMMMQMTFHFSYKNVEILFSGITVHSKLEMAVACFVVFIMAMLYEGLKVLRETLLRRSIDSDENETDQYSPPMSCHQNGDVLVRTNTSRIRKMMSRGHVIQTLLHAVQVSVSYMLMLVVMTYNAFLAISIVVGAVVGYFLFGWKKALVVDVNEHCH